MKLLYVKLKKISSLFIYTMYNKPFQKYNYFKKIITNTGMNNDFFPKLLWK